MATGYGTHSTENTYTANTDNMAISAANWQNRVFDERPDIKGYYSQTNRIITDRYNQMAGLRLQGLTTDNTDEGVIYGDLSSVSGLLLYKDADLTELVASWVDGGSFTDENTSGLALHADNTWTHPTSIADDATIVLFYADFDIYLNSQRSRVAQNIIDDLLTHPQMQEPKAEYLARLNDKSQLADAEVFCFLWRFFRGMAKGDPEEAKQVMAKMYHDLYREEIKKPLGWDTSVSVTEDDDDVVETGDPLIFGVCF